MLYGRKMVFLKKPNGQKMVCQKMSDGTKMGSGKRAKMRKRWDLGAPIPLTVFPNKALV